MKITITGSSGLVGTALAHSFGEHTVQRLVRSKPTSEDQIHWNPLTGELDRSALEGTDVVVHLAGENISTGRWTDSKKKRIRDSRVQTTSLLSQSLARLNAPPKLFISASAIGFYGDRGDEELSENSLVGQGFLAEVCRLWEEATRPAEDKGIRTVHMRLGVVISGNGGMLTRLLLPFRMGVGGRVGSGKQYMSWVSLDDVVGVTNFLIQETAVGGPVNVVSPNPVTNLEFTKALGSTLSRPTVLPMPTFAAKLAFGEMGDELLLSSSRVIPTVLMSTDYKFRHATIETALRDIVAQKSSAKHH